MATQKYQVIDVLSDISGEKGATTVPYSLKGQSYSIDLTETEEKEFHALLAPYIAVSAVGKRRGPRLRSTPEETAKIRDWAAQNGHSLTPSGRVPSQVRQAYMEAMANPPVAASAKPPRKRAPKKAARA